MSYKQEDNETLKAYSISQDPSGNAAKASKSREATRKLLPFLKEALEEYSAQRRGIF